MTVDRALFIVSAGKSSLANGSLDKLLSSLPAVAGVRTELILGYRMLDAPHFKAPQLDGLHTVQLSESASLSESRNRLLSEARELGLLGRNTVVNFPDDDSWFIDDVPSLVRAIRVIEAGYDGVLGCYAPGPLKVDHGRFPKKAAHLTPSLATRCANSVSMVWSAEALRDIGAFDESLGAGTEAGSSEDLDMLLRALNANKLVRYEPHVLIGHAYKPSKTDRYYLGNVACLVKNARQDGRVLALLAKRLAGGALLVINRRLSLQDYGAAWQMMVRGSKGNG